MQCYCFGLLSCSMRVRCWDNIGKQSKVCLPTQTFFEKDMGVSENRGTLFGNSRIVLPLAATNLEKVFPWPGKPDAQGFWRKIGKSSSLGQQRTTTWLLL